MSTNKDNVIFVYDGNCPLCKAAALAFRVKETVGDLHLLNARENKTHPIIHEIKKRELDLDDGMVLRYHGQFYHGQDALHMMALLGSHNGWFNKVNALLFKSKIIAKLSYPFMRTVRNFLIYIKGVPKIRNLSINNQEPIFKAVFGQTWDVLPKVMQDHYAVRPYSGDFVKVEGHLDIRISLFVRIISKLTGMLLSHTGDNVPVTVIFRSGKNSEALYFDRTFHFPDKGNVKFVSRMERIKDNELIEFVGLGIGWKLAYHWNGEKVTLSHRGYVWRVLGVTIPVPLSLVMGKGYAEEIPLSENTFKMWTHAKHFLFGKMFGYAGEFKITEVSWHEKS